MEFGNSYSVILDIQEKYVKCVQVKYSSHSWSVQKTAQREIIIPEDEADSSHYTRISQVIKSLLEEMGIYPPKNLITAINARDAAVKLLNLPPLNNEKMKSIEEMVRYELMMHLPVNIEQMGYDYQVIESNDSGTKVLAAAVKRSVLDRHLRVLSLVGIYPKVITTTSLMLFNTFLRKDPELLRSNCIGLIWLRHENGDMVVCENGILTYARSFTLRADGNKGHLIREIHNSFETYFKQHKSGEESSDEKDHAKQNSLPLICLMTPDGQMPDDIAEDDLRRITPGAKWKTYTAGDDLAFGTAMSGMRSGSVSEPLRPLRLNLLKQVSKERRAEEKKARIGKLGKISPAIAAFVLLIISGLLWQQIQKSKNELHLLEKRQMVENDHLQRISQLNETLEDIQHRTESLWWANEDYPMISYRIYEIAKSLPHSLWLKEIYIPEKIGKKGKIQQSISKLYVVGYAHEQNQIVSFLNNLRKCECFSDVIQESTAEVRWEGARVLEFKIGLTSRISHIYPLAKASLSR
jgi:Tfp pilus assembly protein PilN